MTPEEPRSRDEENWAKPISELHVSHELPSKAVNLNIEGRRVAGISGGFGKMWQKTYTIALTGSNASPEEVVSAWKEHFPDFWPKGNHFYAPLTGVKAGDVVPLSLKMPGGMKLMTGILVLYADEESFSYLMPEGGMFAGLITFSARRGDEGTVAQVQLMIRAQDPLYETAMVFGGHRMEDKQWLHTLRSLAEHFGANNEPAMTKTLVDKRRQWKQFSNVRKNAAIRSGLYILGRPFRALAKPFARKSD
jgi:hypothetical protein